ncbi:MAG: hypothetical protein ABI054_01585, partial [Planctomycetota bacterium]
MNGSSAKSDFRLRALERLQRQCDARGWMARVVDSRKANAIAAGISTALAVLFAWDRFFAE